MTCAFDPGWLCIDLELIYSYDIWDLGEFDQKGGQRTKWGTKEDLLQAIKVAKEKGIITYIDAVMNHKCAERFFGCRDKANYEEGQERTTKRSSWRQW
jgi:hypothetical protein